MANAKLLGDPPLDWPHYGIGPVAAIRRGFLKYATLSGRASPSEYWWWVLFIGAGWFGLLLLGSLTQSSQNSRSIWFFGIVVIVFWLATILPTLAVTIRRLHDTGRSGRTCLIVLIPIVGSLIVAVYLIGGTAPNAVLYGPPGDARTRPPTLTAPAADQDLPSRGNQPERRPMSRGLLAALVVVAVVVAGSMAAVAVRSGLGSWLNLGPSRPTADPGASAGGRDTHDPANQQTAYGGGSPSSPGDPPSADASAATPGDATSTRPSSPRDPPSRVGDRAKIVRTSDGTSCRTTKLQGGYGTYRLASCKLWQVADGLISGEAARKGAKQITCQRNLGVSNPVYKAGQTNTWWVWTTSNRGTWDWFPETAVAEGASNEPINGIALCQDNS
jgi:uncharacterized membrane protein YhaH (DUF805 family)